MLIVYNIDAKTWYVVLEKNDTECYVHWKHANGHGRGGPLGGSWGGPGLWSRACSSLLFPNSYVAYVGEMSQDPLYEATAGQSWEMKRIEPTGIYNSHAGRIPGVVRVATRDTRSRVEMTGVFREALWALVPDGCTAEQI